MLSVSISITSSWDNFSKTNQLLKFVESNRNTMADPFMISKKNPRFVNFSQKGNRHAKFLLTPNTSILIAVMYSGIYLQRTSFKMTKERFSLQRKTLAASFYLVGLKMTNNLLNNQMIDYYQGFGESKRAFLCWYYCKNALSYHLTMVCTMYFQVS